MTDSLTRKRPAYIDPAGEPIKAPAWRNLLFDKSGLSYRGPNVFPSQEEARSAADRTCFENLVLKIYTEWETLDGPLPNEKYAYNIQIPAQS